MYEKIPARFYDLLQNNFKNYAKDVEVIRNHLRQNPRARSLLDVACGTGNHLRYFYNEFDVEGLDISREMLACAQEKMPNVRFHQASMLDFKLDKKFDVVLCLYRSIAFAKTKEGLLSSIQAMSDHLNPGGLLMIDPFFTPEQCWEHDLRMHHIENDEFALTWMYSSSKQDDVAVMDHHYLLGERGLGVMHHFEQRFLGLFTQDDFFKAFAQVGLSVYYDSVGLDGVGLYIAKKPQNLVFDSNA